MTRPSILIGETAFAESARAILADIGDVVDYPGPSGFAERLRTADAVVVGLEIRLEGGLLAQAERLRVIASRTSQLRHLDVHEAERRGIAILSIEADAPALRQTSSTAEEAFGLLLALVRNIPWAFDALKEERWERHRYGGHELAGKVIGIVGFGRLGRRMARYGAAFEMKVIASDPYVPDAEIVAAGSEPAPLYELLAASDVVSLHCSWSDETRGLIGARELARMRPGAFLVNTARGEITDEQALVDALASGALGGAAVDTLANERPDGSHLRNNPLVAYARAHENLIVVPHLGGATREATERTQLFISERLRDWLVAHT